MTGDYRFSVSPEHPDSTQHAVAQAIPFAETTSLHEHNDKDVFAFEAVVGSVYGIHTDVESPLDTVLTLIAPDRETVLATNDDESDYSIASRLNWTATQSGLHFVSVASHNDHIGNYQFFITEGQTTPVIEAPAERLPKCGKCTDGTALALRNRVW